MNVSTDDGIEPRGMPEPVTPAARRRTPWVSGGVLASLAFAGTAWSVWPFGDCDLDLSPSLLPCNYSPGPAPALGIGAVPDPFVQLPGFVPGTELIRVSAPPAPGEPAPLHGYSRRQAWNRDESLLILGDRVLDTATFETVLERLPVSSERNWSNLEPDLVIGIVFDPEPNRLVRYDVRTGEAELLRHFENYVACSLGSGEGNISFDDTRVALACRKADESTELVSYAIDRDEILGTLDADENYNWVSFTNLGRWIVVENSREGVETRALIRYDETFSDPMTLVTDDVEHGDLGVDENGDEVFAMIDYRSYRYVRIADGIETTLGFGGRSGSIGYGHISCRNIDRPGWCYVSNYGNGSIGAIRIGRREGVVSRALEGSPVDLAGYAAFERWGYHHSVGDSYRARAKASVSPSGHQIVFTSDWGGQAPISDYVIRLSPSGESPAASPAAAPAAAAPLGEKEP